ncbi:MAG TPA: glycosyltransferase family 4 protein [Pirellulaceae bacterium]|nr:glycosyltransferase family 4 protein [Pirellulaceae bacterium]HMO93438.1 glycosyltransferase family 4 protein [Pirellulaceae bacterium]HMP68454.1 glycosyltransferase family 4 protein [Pirellulaceae bacterium]
MASMRILQLITRRQRRGAEVFATELSDVLASRGHEVLVVGLYEPDGEMLVPGQAGFHDLGARRNRSLSWTTIQLVRQKIKDYQPDLVQANGADTFKYSALAKFVSRGKFPLVYRNISIASTWLRGRLHRSWGRWLVRQIDQVVSVSDASADDFANTYRFPLSRITSIPRAVRLPLTLDAHGARERLIKLAPIPRDAKILMHVGSLTPEKNHLWMLNAFASIEQQQPDTHLVLIGDGPLRREIEQAIAHQQARANIHLIGLRADASDLVAAADLFILPSLIEGIPGALLEAAACAVPSVATNVGGLAQAVLDRETGVLIKSGDTAGFVLAVTQLLQDDRRRLEMGQRAREYVSSRFHLESVADQYELLYHRLTGIIALPPRKPAPAQPASIVTKQ